MAVSFRVTSPQKAAAFSWETTARQETAILLPGLV